MGLTAALPDVRRARLAVGTLFLLNGATLGSWVARIPVVQDVLGLDDARLGTALLGLSAGVVVTLPIAGGIVARRGARPVTAIGTAIVAVALAVVPHAGTLLELFGALLLLGVGMSSVDVSMNAQGVAVERMAGRRVMVGLHGVWSAGGLIGTGLGSLAIAAGLSTSTHLLIAGAVVALAGAAAISQTGHVPTGQRETTGPALVWPRGALWLLGIVALSSAFGEGGIADWGGIYLRDVAGASDATAPLGFLVFSLTMATMRFLGDAVATRLGASLTVRLGGAVAGVGMAIALLVPSVPVALVGFGLAGVGLSVIVPLSFAAAGRTPGITEGEAVAAVATVAYSALLAGPPIIGFLSRATNLTVSLGLVALVVGSIGLSGRAIRD